MEYRTSMLNRCALSWETLGAYADREFEHVTPEGSQHTRRCLICQAISEQIVELGSALRTSANYYPAPPALRERIAKAAQP